MTPVRLASANAKRISLLVSSAGFGPAQFRDRIDLNQRTRFDQCVAIDIELRELGYITNAFLRELPPYLGETSHYFTLPVLLI